MKKTLKIEGMHCSHCSGRVEKALATLGLFVSVDLAAATAVVEADTLPDDSVLRETVEDLGFDVTEIK